MVIGTKTVSMDCQKQSNLAKLLKEGKMKSFENDTTEKFEKEKHRKKEENNDDTLLDLLPLDPVSDMISPDLVKMSLCRQLFF